MAFGVGCPVVVENETNDGADYTCEDEWSGEADYASAGLDDGY